LILKKIIEIVAARCHMLELKYTKFDFSAPQHLAGFLGFQDFSKGMGRKDRRKGQRRG